METWIKTALLMGLPPDWPYALALAFVAVGCYWGLIRLIGRFCAFGEDR